MHCQYCHQRVSIFKLLSGQPFCSKEHRELYLNTQSKDAIKRLLSSFSEEGGEKRPEAPTPTPAQAPEPTLAPSAPTSNEVAVVSTEPPEPPEAPFLLTDLLPPPKSRPPVLISRTVVQPPSVEVQLPSSPAPERISTERAYVGEPMEAEPEEIEPEPPLAPLAALEIELAPAAPANAPPRSSAQAEHEQETPSIVSTPATETALGEPGLLSLPMGQKHITEVPVPISDPQEIVPAPGSPSLALRDAEVVAETAADVLTPPPPAPARLVWPEQRDAASLSSLAPVGALRPRSSGPRTLNLSIAATLVGLGQAEDARDLVQQSVAPGATSAESAVPLLQDFVALCAPGPSEPVERNRALPSPATLFPIGLPAPTASTSRLESTFLPWRLAVGAPRFPHVAGAIPNIRLLAGPAAVKTPAASEQPAVFEAASSIPVSHSVRLPAEPLPSVCSPLTLPLSAEALPSPKTSTREPAFRAPAPELRPSLPYGLDKTQLPNRMAAPVLWSTLPAAGSPAFRLPPGIAPSTLPVSGLGEEIRVALALPGPGVEQEQPLPLVSGATHEIAFSSANWIAATHTAAPLAADQALRCAKPMSIPAASNAVAALAELFTIEPAPLLHVSSPAALRVPSPEPVPTSIHSRSIQIASAFAPPALRTSSNIRPIWQDESLAMMEWTGQTKAGQPHLQASRPSPLSLLTAPRARSTSAWAATLLHPKQPIPVALEVVRGQAVSTPLFSQAGSGRRVGLPHPERPNVSFGLPALSTASPVAVQAHPPGNATQQIPIAAGRIVPASLPVLPGMFRGGSISATAALHVSGTLPDWATPLPSSPTRMAGLNWEIRTAFVTAIPRTNPSAYSPALCQATYSQGMAGRTIAPPPAQPKQVPVESSRQRLSRALSSSLRSLFPLHS